MPTKLVNSATPVVVTEIGDPPFTIGAVPGSGCTVLVEVQLINGGAWYQWDPGPVTAQTARVVTGPLNALRFTRTVGTQNCTFEYR